MCSASDSNNADATKDDWCATFGYVWTTGSLSGNVGGQKGHKVAIDPATGHGATDDSTRTGTGGAYAFTGVQDGEYSATASDNGNYTVDGPATAKGIALYHDEFADNEGEDKADSAWAGRRAQATHSWQVTKGGLSIMGFVANDNGDNLIRGDEAVAGIEVKLLTNVTFHPSTAGDNAGKLKSSKTAQTAETAGNGLYSFTGLDDKTKYWVQVPAGGYINLNAKNPSLHGGTGGLAADVYPALPDENTYAKPSWGTTSASNTTVPISDGATTNAVEATLYNFALVYSDGTVAGKVSNASGSNANIDVRISNNLNDDEAERTSGADGAFSLMNVMEGTYTAEIEDAGWAAPCMSDTTATGGPAGMPDDDGPVDGNGACVTAASTIEGTLSGRNDYADLGTLYVYSSTASVNDTLTDAAAVSVKTRIAGNAATDNTNTYHDTVTWNATPSGGWSRSAGATTANSSSLGTTSWRQRTVTFSFTPTGVPTGAIVNLSVGTGTAEKACAGYTCTLAADTTNLDPTDAATVMENTINVKVTAANGYDDHVYTVLVSRAAPVNNVLATTDVTSGGNNAGGAGTAGDEFTLSTANATTSSLLLHIDQTFLGHADAENLHCPQTVVVREEATGGTVDAEDQHRTDDCPGERYQLTGIPASGVKDYLLDITSEDGKTRRYYLEVSRGA